MKAIRVAAIVAAAIALAAPAHADVDTDFANQLYTHGIYGPRDYNAWLGKIVCDRLHKRVDVALRIISRAISRSKLLVWRRPVHKPPRVHKWQHKVAIESFLR
jgi:hypothetical protein